MLCGAGVTWVRDQYTFLLSKPDLELAPFLCGDGECNTPPPRTFFTPLLHTSRLGIASNITIRFACHSSLKGFPVITTSFLELAPMGEGQYKVKSSTPQYLPK
jgi:hypothetical protein